MIQTGAKMQFKNKFFNKITSSESSPEYLDRIHQALLDVDNEFIKLEPEQMKSILRSVLDACDDYIENIPKEDLHWKLKDDEIARTHPNYFPVATLCRDVALLLTMPHFKYDYDANKNVDENNKRYMALLRWRLFADTLGTGEGKPLEKEHWIEKRFNGNPFFYRYWIADATSRQSSRQARQDAGFAYFANPASYKVKFEDGKLYVSDGSNYQLLDDDDCAAHLASGETIYVIDTDKNFYVFHNLVPKDIEGGIQHSSLLMGKPVLCAGTIKVKQGKLSYIDIGSGHYKPQDRHLLKALGVLSENGVTLSEVNVCDVFPPPYPKPEINAEIYLSEHPQSKPSLKKR